MVEVHFQVLEKWLVAISIKKILIAVVESIILSKFN